MRCAAGKLQTHTSLSSLSESVSQNLSGLFLRPLSVSPSSSAPKIVEFVSRAPVAHRGFVGRLVKAGNYSIHRDTIEWRVLAPPTGVFHGTFAITVRVPH